MTQQNDSRAVILQFLYHSLPEFLSPFVDQDCSHIFMTEYCLSKELCQAIASNLFHSILKLHVLHFANQLYLILLLSPTCVYIILFNQASPSWLTIINWSYYIVQETVLRGPR